MSEEELEEMALECLTVEQNIQSLEREIADHYQEILAAKKRFLAPEDRKHLDRAVMMFESGIRYDKASIEFLRAFGDEGRA
jgi:hypothetical protein